MVSGKDNLNPVNATKDKLIETQARDLWQHLVQSHFLYNHIGFRKTAHEVTYWRDWRRMQKFIIRLVLLDLLCT